MSEIPCYLSRTSMYNCVLVTCLKFLEKRLLIYLFICSLWLPGCIIFWGCSCAADAMPPLTSTLVLISLTSEGWQAEPFGAFSYKNIQLETSVNTKRDYLLYFYLYYCNTPFTKTIIFLNIRLACLISTSLHYI